MNAEPGGFAMRTKPRRAVRGACAVALVVAFGALLPGSSQAQSTAATGLSTAQHPVIDTNFLYHELYYSSTQFISRVAGADGPPSSPSDVNNLPANYNGTNEFYT